ncbi:MAG TPA: aminotransferase class I/II-fold pyridoxal phosphate-dependent enzyme [Ktedonobacterales bacterium]|nr:aminotransferase class I/II-fold pyridoxal phosphate-dependent enzyme [Ktedonobacterales bacterium]
MNTSEREPAPVTRRIASLPATVPFTAPEALERSSGRPFVLRLGANESTFGPAPRVREAMRAAVDRVQFYADPECYELRAALADQYGVRIENVVVGSGIDDLLGLVVRAFLDEGETAVTSRGAYPTFNYHVAGYGGTLEMVPYRNDRNDLEALAAAAHQTSARLIFLANPDNPTGSYYSAAELRTFMDALPARALLLLDEAYVDFAPAEALLPLDVADTRVIRLRTFSKAHGMAGARIGYAAGAASIIREFEKIRLHFGVNLMAQAGALASLASTDYIADVVAEVARGREEYAALARELRMSPLPSAASFVALDTGSAERARALMAALAARDVFVRMPGVPPLDRCIRVTVGTPTERAAFAAVLREVWPHVVS